jgi:hypothetical protein
MTEAVELTAITLSPLVESVDIFLAFVLRRLTESVSFITRFRLERITHLICSMNRTLFYNRLPRC